MDNESLEMFFETYNSLSNSPMLDIEKGNIRTKYYARSYNTSIEVLYPTGGGLDITITATNDNDNRNVFSDDMRNAFYDVVKTLNADISDDAISAAWDDAVGGELRGSMEDVSYAFYTHEARNAVGAQMLRGLGAMGGDFGKLIASTPVGDKTLIDEALSDGSKALRSMSWKGARQSVKVLAQAKAGFMRPFIDSVNEMNRLHNNPVLVAIGEDDVYILHE